jgi:flagellar hook-basal body complex protein FliE
MKNINKFKSLIYIVLPMIMMSFSVILDAASSAPAFPSAAEHQQTIYQFISEIKDAQDRSAAIAQATLRGSTNSTTQLQLEIDSISADLQALNQIIEDYADIVQGLTPEDRHVRLTFNVLNLVRSNLYTLSLLLRSATNIERIELLDEYFQTRRNALSTLMILENSLATYKV